MDLGLTATLLGAGLEGIGKITSGYETNLAYQFNAAVARANAEALRTSSEFDERRLRKAKGRFTSLQRAGYAKAGVKMEGSPIEVLIDSAAEAEIDILINRYNTRMKDIQYGVEADQSKIAGKAAVRQGWLGAASTLLSTAGLFYQGKKDTGKK